MRVLDLGFGAKVILTETKDGDLGNKNSDGNTLALRRAVVGRPWVTVEQIHSDLVLSFDSGMDCDTSIGIADAIVTKNRTVAIAVFAADCGNVGLVGDNNMIAAVHCGWRGLENGILQNTIDELIRTGASNIYAVVGPNIGPECYEFQKKDMVKLIELYGSEIESVTSSGTPSLNISQCIQKILDNNNVKLVYKEIQCTKCADDYFSYRYDATDKRQSLIVYFDEA